AVVASDVAAGRLDPVPELVVPGTARGRDDVGRRWADRRSVAEPDERWLPGRERLRGGAPGRVDRETPTERVVEPIRHIARRVVIRRGAVSGRVPGRAAASAGLIRFGAAVRARHELQDIRGAPR